MTDVESDEFRKARKQRYREAMRAGTEATLEKGRVMDGVHNEKVLVEHVRSAGEILAEAREVAESIDPASIMVDRDAVVTEFTVEMRENTVIVDTPDSHSVETFEPEEEPPEETDDVNETISELEQLSAQIAQLERELKEKENSTD